MTEVNPVTDLTSDGEIAVITLNSPPVNALVGSDARRPDRGGAKAEADAGVKAMLLICAGAPSSPAPTSPNSTR